MPTLTIDEAVKNHRMMWSWMADKTEKEEKPVIKSEALDHFGWSWDYPFNGCWACEYAMRHSGARLDDACKACPLDWPYGACNGNHGLYEKWRDACYCLDYTHAAMYAREIANLRAKPAAGY